MDIFLRFKDMIGGYFLVRKSDVSCIGQAESEKFLRIYLKENACNLEYLNTLNTIGECETIINETN